MDATTFKEILKSLTDYVICFKKSQDVRCSTLKPNYMEKLSNRSVTGSVDWKGAFELFKEYIEPGVVNWAHPFFFGYFPAGHSYESIIADFLISSLNNNGFTWLASPANVECELVTLCWLGRALGIPKNMLPYSSNLGGGVILSSASECVFIALLCAINKCGGKRENLVVYSSVLAHPCVEKACRILGVKNRKIDVEKSTMGMSLSKLRESIEEDERSGKFRPCAILATFGTTSCGSIDDIVGIASLRKNIYIHVDGAYGGAMLLLRKCKPQ